MSDEFRPPAEPTTNPVSVLLVGSAAPALLAVAATAGVAVGFGADHVLSALVGGGLGMLALAVGPALNQLCRNLDPTLVIGLAVLAYCLVIGLLWVGYSLLTDTSWLVGEFAAAGLFVASLAWAVGHMRAALKLRQLLYQQE